MLLFKTAFKAQEEKKDVILILFPGRRWFLVFFFGGLRAAMDCIYHTYCTVGRKEQAEPFLLRLQRAPVPVKANMT